MNGGTAQALRVSGLSVSIPLASGTLQAVRNINLVLRPGQTLGVVGESGSGKSITALAIMKLLPPAARRSAGAIRLGSTDLMAADERELAMAVRGKRIGMIFQEPMTSLNPVYTIGRQLIETMTLRGEVSATAAEARAVFLLEKVGLPDPRSRLGQYPHQLSGGQRQRVMIAMALMNEPELLIADEPTTALDVTIQAQILRLLADLQREFGMSMILITHDLGVVARVADRVAVMYAGEIVETGTVAEVLSDPRHPYTRGLLACVPDTGNGENPRRLGSIPGIVPSMIGDTTGCAFASRCPRVVARCRVAHPPRRDLGPERSFLCFDPRTTDANASAVITDNETAVPRIAPGATAAADTILAVRDVSCTFRVRRGFFGRPRPLRAVDHVDLDVRRGEVLALVGESGCGKTTLSRIMLGSQRIDSGDVMLDGTLLSALPDKQRARRIQPIFQDPYSSLNPRRTISEIIAQPLRVHGIGDAASRLAQTERMMDLVGLPRRLFHSYPSQLSGGQRQRAAIARAIIMAPDLLICDEPTSALDVSVQSQILNLLLDLRDELHLTYLFITHNLSIVRYLADRIAVMYFGQIVELGDKHAVLENPRHPYTRALLKSILSITPGAGIPDAGLGADFPNPLDVPRGCRFHPRCPLADDRCRNEVPQPVWLGGAMARCLQAYGDEKC
ncbi:MAG TPA: ABC transporter ATP-binding protein [Burkholderiales bacterium]|nr:ABC transporter ATP-binding protein [Burkholderiales bacterium]